MFSTWRYRSERRIYIPMDVDDARNKERFVWESEKAASNLAKHGVAFHDAIDVFFDAAYQLVDASVPEERREADRRPEGDGATARLRWISAADWVLHQRRNAAG